MIDMTVMRVTFSRCIGRNRRGKVKSKTGMEVPKAGGRLTPFKILNNLFSRDYLY